MWGMAGQRDLTFASLDDVLPDVEQVLAGHVLGTPVQGEAPTATPFDEGPKSVTFPAPPSDRLYDRPRSRSGPSTALRTPGHRHPLERQQDHHGEPDTPAEQEAPARRDVPAERGDDRQPVVDH